MKSHHRSHIKVPCDFGRASKRPRATSKPFGPTSPPVYLSHPSGRSLPSTLDIFLPHQWSFSARLPYPITRSVARSHLSFPLSPVYTSPSLGWSLPQLVTKKIILLQLPPVYTLPLLGRSLHQLVTKKIYSSAVTTPTIHFST